MKELKPSLLLLDVRMPGMNGFDVAAVLKNDPSCVNIPIVILSVEEEETRGKRLGVERYFIKPLNTAQLLREISTLLDGY